MIGGGVIKLLIASKNYFLHLIGRVFFEEKRFECCRCGTGYHPHLCIKVPETAASKAQHFQILKQGLSPQREVRSCWKEALLCGRSSRRRSPVGPANDDGTKGSPTSSSPHNCQVFCLKIGLKVAGVDHDAMWSLFTQGVLCAWSCTHGLQGWGRGGSESGQDV